VLIESCANVRVQGVFGIIYFFEILKYTKSKCSIFLKNNFKKKKVLIFIKVQYNNILNVFLADYNRL